MVLFVLGSLSLLSVLASSLTGTFDNRARLTATNLAASDIDEARSLDYFALAPADYTKTVDGRDYRVVREVVVTTATGSDTSACVGSGGVKQFYKRVSTRVTTAFRGATTRAVRADTLVDAPLINPNSTKGALGFTVFNRTSTPISGLAVAVPGFSRTTDSRGCAFFDGMDPGDYTVTVTRPGTVTKAGSSTLSKTVRVTAGRITADSLHTGSTATFAVKAAAYEGTTLRTGFSTPGGAVATIAASDRRNPTRITYPSKAVTANVDTTWAAYPSLGGYDAWIGTCSQLVGHDDSEPGSSPRALLQLSPVTVHLYGQNTGDGYKTQGKSVSLTWSPTSSCTETLSYPATTDTGCSPNTGATGSQCLLKLAVPPGSWTFKIDGLTYATTATIGTRTAHTVMINTT